MSTPAFNNNTYVPEVQQNLLVSYSRNPSKFPLNKYIQIVPVKKQAGYYTKMTRDEAGRVLETDGKDRLWNDGADRPSHANETEQHDFVLYGCKRRNFGYTIGKLAQEQAVFDVKAHAAGTAAEKAMRLRTQLMATVMTTTGNYDTGHYSAVASISGNSGKWDESTTARSDIKRSLHYAAELIMKNTLNAVEPEDLRLILSAGAARKIAQTQEIIDYLKGAAGDALAQIRGEGKNAMFGLPDRLYGYEVVVESTYKTTTRKGASSTTKSSIFGDTNAVMCSRVGALTDERASEAASFSSFTMFTYEEMTVEEFDDTRNRRIEGHVTEDYDMVFTAPASAFLFTSIVN